MRFGVGELRFRIGKLGFRIGKLRFGMSKSGSEELLVICHVAFCDDCFETMFFVHCVRWIRIHLLEYFQVIFRVTNVSLYTKNISITKENNK